MIRGVPMERAAAAVCAANLINNLLPILVCLLDLVAVVLPLLAGVNSLQEVRGGQQHSTEIPLPETLAASDAHDIPLTP